MQRQEICLALLSYALAGVFLAYVIAHSSWLDYDPEIYVNIVGILKLVMPCFVFLGLFSWACSSGK